MEHDLNDFWHKLKIYNFDPCNVLLAIATNIPVLLMTGSRDTFMNSLHILLLWCPFGVSQVSFF